MIQVSEPQMSVLYFLSRVFLALKRFHGTVQTKQDRKKLYLSYLCLPGQLSDSMSRSQFLVLSCFSFLCALLSPPFPCLASRLYFSATFEQVTTLLFSPPSLFPHFTSDFVFFLKYPYFFCLV